jgi:hypothetical protein
VLARFLKVEKTERLVCSPQCREAPSDRDRTKGAAKTKDMRDGKPAKQKQAANPPAHARLIQLL